MRTLARCKFCRWACLHVVTGRSLECSHCRNTWDLSDEEIAAIDKRRRAKMRTKKERTDVCKGIRPKDWITCRS